MVLASGPRAVLDIGSNTIRLLVARAEGDALIPLVDQSEFVRLGFGVDKTGELAIDRQEAALRAVSDLLNLSRSLCAEDPLAVATSAVRDARNGRAFVERVENATGLTMRVLSGEEEARLTFLGATFGVAIENGAIVVDLGGGSAEVIAAQPGKIAWARSLQLGSGRMTEQFLHGDPPEESGLMDLRRHVTVELDGLPAASAATAIFTGGTASHLALLIGKSAPLVRLAPGDIQEALRLVTKETQAELVRRFGIRPERAEVLPAGLAILAVIASYYEIGEIAITRQGIREGVILEALGTAFPSTSADIG